MDDAKKTEWLKEQKKISGFLHRVFDTDDGKDVLKWLSELCHENEQTFVPGQADVSNFKEGQRFVILALRKALSAKYD